ncbi:MAG: hypothetical protein R6U44_11970 [Archaeoglobaceae archaeon]
MKWRKGKVQKVGTLNDYGVLVGDSVVAHKNRIEVKCESSPVPFYELVESRIVKIRINPVKNSNGGHTAGISMVTERNGNFYEVTIEGDVTECSEREVVTNGNKKNLVPANNSLFKRLKNRLYLLKNREQPKNNSNERIEVIERNEEIIIKKE